MHRCFPIMHTLITDRQARGQRSGSSSAPWMRSHDNRTGQRQQAVCRSTRHTSTRHSSVLRIAPFTDGHCRRRTRPTERSISSSSQARKSLTSDTSAIVLGIKSQ